MKTKRLRQRVLALFLAVLTVFTGVPVNGLAEGEVLTYEKVTDVAEFTTGQYVMVTDTGFAPGPMNGTNWVSAVSVNPTDGKLSLTEKNAECTIVVEGNGAKIKLSDGKVIAPLIDEKSNGIRSDETEEYHWIWEMNGSGKFTFTGVENAVRLASNKGEKNQFRAYKLVTITTSPAGYPSEFSLYKLKDTLDTSIAAPTASPSAGEVEKGTAITLWTETSGAQIYFTLDGTTPDVANEAQRYSEMNRPVILSDSILKAVAVLDGVLSTEKTFSYTLKIVPPENDKPIKNGQKVVIYAPAYGMALSGDYTGFYNKGTPVTVEGDNLSGYTDADIWTVVDNGDGTYSFEHNGQKIGLGDSYNSMPLGEKNNKWMLEKSEADTWYVKNTVRGLYMEWLVSKSNWSAFGTIAPGTEGMFRLKFYEVKDDPVPPDDTDLTVTASPPAGTIIAAGQNITLSAAKDVQIFYTMAANGTLPAEPDVTQETQRYTAPILVNETPTPEKPLIIKAVGYLPAKDGSEAKIGEVAFFAYRAPVNNEEYNIYFGQLHSHTNLSDGTGTVKQAFDHASKVNNLDFLAITDHSNSFDGGDKVHLNSTDAESLSSKWKTGRSEARAINARENGTFIGLYGFEMTWSNGSPGHMNTFNSEGFESREMAPYKKGASLDVLKAYYKTLNENPQTITQFNHPGKTFGDFEDFALYDEVTDRQVTLLEVGNGEGKVGASGYFPSYTYYTRALDKGWHVAPTNNQDNHKGNWGDANTARSVVLATDLSEKAIYDAMKNYRVYATEDNDLSIRYTLNGHTMGTILGEQETVNIEVKISDPTDTSGTTKVEVIVNGGKALSQKNLTGGSGTVTFDNLTGTHSYYYLRITQADGNVAVTAPVWIGESLSAGISKTESNLKLPVKGDEITISSQVHNNLEADMTITSLTYSIEGQETPFHTADVSKVGKGGIVEKKTSLGYAFPWKTVQAGNFNITATMTAVIGGVDYTFTDVLKLSVSDPSITTKVLIDGTHYNDYVTGYYAGNMTNFIDLGAANNTQVRVAQPGESITSDTLKDVSLFVISAPLNKTDDYTAGAQPSVFEDSFVALVKDYVANGGTVVICGLADYQDSPNGAPYTTYVQANKLLTAIGSTMKINDDEIVDQTENGGSAYRLYFNDFNTASTDPVVQELLKGVKESGLTYSSYSGCSVSAGNGVPVVYGHDTTWSINSKSPSQGHDKPVLGFSAPYDAAKAVITKGNVVAMATEAVGKGRVYATGTVFCSSFEIAAGEAQYANTILMENILKMVQKDLVISTIEEARKGQTGEVFTVIGTVANGTAETGNAFFNTIYIQDEKGNGINIFPIDGNDIHRGDQVMVTGSVSEYLGDRQLAAFSVTVLEGKKEVVITSMTTKAANDYDTNFGRLVKVEGIVKSVKTAGGVIEAIELLDESGESCRVFIDGYIEYSDETSKALEEFVKTGAKVNAIGFVSHDPEGNRLRVRDRSEIEFVKAEEEIPEKPEEPGNGGGSGTHTHNGNGAWVSDMKEHWHVCSCGDIIGKTAHTPGKDGVCTGCGKVLFAADNSVNNAQTGDENSVAVWIVLILVTSGLATFVLVENRKKSKK